jgi:hypothetical protein
MSYRYEARSVEGFVQILAANYISRGYRFYITGQIPEGKDPLEVDRKLVSKYGLNLSPWARSRRKRAGGASVQYLRHARFFVLLATSGEHPFFREEHGIRDFREQPLRYGGYSLSHRFSPVTKRSHAHVRIDRERYLEIRAYLAEIAMHRSVENLTQDFHRLPFAPFAPVRRQFLNLLRLVNKLRRIAGYERVPTSALRLRRKPVKVYADCAASLMEAA